MRADGRTGRERGETTQMTEALLEDLWKGEDVVEASDLAVMSQ